MACFLKRWVKAGQPSYSLSLQCSLVPGCLPEKGPWAPRLLRSRVGYTECVSTVFGCHPIRRLNSYANLLKAVYNEGKFFSHELSQKHQSSLDLAREVFCTTLKGPVNYLFFIIPPLNSSPIAEAGGYCLVPAVCNLNSWFWQRESFCSVCVRNTVVFQSVASPT